MYALLFVIAAAAPDDSPAFVAITPADDRPSGRLVRLAADFSALLATKGDESAVPYVLSLRRLGRVLPPFPTGPQIVTAYGDRIPGTLVGGNEIDLRFSPSILRLKDVAAWKVPLSAAVVVWFVDTPSDTLPDPARYEWLAGTKNRDTLRFGNGDIAKGTLAGIDPDEAKPVLKFRPEQGEARAVSGEELAAVAFNPALIRARKLKGAFVRIVLTDGSRVAMTNATASDGFLVGNTLFGQKAEFPLAEVVAIDVMHGKAAFLSDLKPKKVEQVGFLGVAWTWIADRNVRGGPLKLETRGGESTYDKGIGTHPRTVLTYELAGKYRRFEALVGLDPGCQIRGRAAVRVLVDGKEQNVPGLAALGSGVAVPVLVGVKGAKELTLAIDFGPAGGAGADVNWADARLVE